ncbi:MAG TPA: hypothetical protein PLA02_00650 [Brevefilum fermentans]|jgi:hypothetical protein|uniref:PsbP C-terminal domain-containing protein n=1 Tax=Candidatus Brevifilum fermentans TaxID=1986204 RepID=A0A1Y6K5A0_9CHLR|nr:hypothetical protein [Brevefilum fermentans]MDI9566876.1 hypothetical protein [Chloroflexota bacterium]OQB84845.1 MAG: hypothetical protein BWX85_00882 [Chloroflexi bacterium ADurb.Bin120]SMX53759.1 exported protein of unknown function [Brevefilum fermentans]HOM68106.1 hypothetical protein [Brevefilum fermentans]HPX95325.1 hypothetical protein [Brevefilum fermentans]
MQRRKILTFIFSLMSLLILTSCNSNKETADWKVFRIDQEPALNIEFRLPPGWLVDYAPNRDKPGQWEVTLVPPKCTPTQEVEFQNNCITLVAHIKEKSTFSKEAFVELTGSDIPLSIDGSRSALFLGLESFRVNRIKVERYNHLIKSVNGNVHMSTYFFETDSAYFIFITNFPYEQAENETLDNFGLLLESLKTTR